MSIKFAFSRERVLSLYMLPQAEIAKLAGVVIHQRDMSPRLFNALVRHTKLVVKAEDPVGEESVIPADQLASLYPDRLLLVTGVGKKGVEEIKQYLQKLAEEQKE